MLGAVDCVGFGGVVRRAGIDARGWLGICFRLDWFGDAAFRLAVIGICGRGVVLG